MVPPGPEPSTVRTAAPPGAETGAIDEARLRRLIEVGRELAGVSDTATVIESALTAAQELTGARYAALGVLDADRTGLERVLTLGIDDATKAAIGDAPHGQGVIGVLIERAEPLVLEDLNRHPRAHGFPPDHPPMKTFLGVPVRVQGEVWGALYMTEKKDGLFDESDVESAVILAEWIALAISNVRSADAERVRLRIEAAERERRRWARELHDETLQDLAGLRVLLSGTRRRNATGPVSPVLDQAIERIDVTIIEMRRLIADLRPAALDELGVGPALTSLIDRITGSWEMDVDLQVELPDREAGRLVPEIEDTIYRLVQESLNNAVRHGKARRAIVEVIEQDGEVAVRVIDDGSGFNPHRPGGGFGLLGMRERVELSGGRLDIRSRPGGTTVSATLPARRPTEHSSPDG